MTQRDIKDKLNNHGIKVSVDFISKVETGKREPSIEMAIVWADILNETVENCFGNRFRNKRRKKV